MRQKEFSFAVVSIRQFQSQSISHTVFQSNISVFHAEKMRSVITHLPISWLCIQVLRFLYWNLVQVFPTQPLFSLYRYLCYFAVYRINTFNRRRRCRVTVWHDTENYSAQIAQGNDYFTQISSLIYLGCCTEDNSMCCLQKECFSSYHKC